MSNHTEHSDATRSDELPIERTTGHSGPSQDQASARLAAQGQARMESSHASQRESIEEGESGSNHEINLPFYRANFWKKHNHVGGGTERTQRSRVVHVGLWIGVAVVAVGGGAALLAKVTTDGARDPDPSPSASVRGPSAGEGGTDPDDAGSDAPTPDGGDKTARLASLAGEVDELGSEGGDDAPASAIWSVRSRQQTIAYDQLGPSLERSGLFAWDHNLGGQRVQGKVEVSNVDSPYFAQLVWCPPAYHSPMDRMGVGRDSLLMLPGNGRLFEKDVTPATIDPLTNAVVNINEQPATIESYRLVMASARPGDTVRLGISVAAPDGGSREERHERWPVRNIRTTVYRDHATGLEWIDPTAGAPMGIENAYANWYSSRLIGRGARCDWRVPTIEELLTLVGPDRDDRVALRNGFEFSPSAYWTFDVMSPDTNAWYAVDFTKKRISALPEASLLLVRTVHEHDDAELRQVWPGHEDDFLYPVLAVDTVTPVAMPVCHAEPPTGREAPHPVPSAWLAALDRRGAQHAPDEPGGGSPTGDTGSADVVLPHNVGGPDVEAAIRQILSGPNRAVRGADPVESDR